MWWAKYIDIDLLQKVEEKNKQKVYTLHTCIINGMALALPSRKLKSLLHSIDFVKTLLVYKIP